MYAGLWRILPGPIWVKAPILLLLFFALVFVLFEHVFPWAAANIEWLGDPSFNDDVTVE